MTLGARFVRGDIESATGRLMLERDDGSVTGQCPELVMVRATLTDNNDSTINLTFGS